MRRVAVSSLLAVALLHASLGTAARSSATAWPFPSPSFPHQRLHRCRTGVLVGSAVSVLVVSAAVLRVRPAPRYRPGAAGLYPAATAAAGSSGRRGVLVLLFQRPGLLSERRHVSRAVGAGDAQGPVRGRTMRSAVLSIIVGVLLTACATVPPGPSVMVLPGSGKN